MGEEDGGKRSKSEESAGEIKRREILGGIEEPEQERRGFMGSLFGGITISTLAINSDDQSAATDDGERRKPPVVKTKKGEQLLQKYSSRKEVKSAISEYTSGLMRYLRRDLLNGDDLVINKVVQKPTRHTDAAFTTVVRKEGEITALIELDIPNTDGEVTIFVLPEIQKSYAISKIDNVPKIIDPAANMTSISCYYDTVCRHIGSGIREQEIYCCPSYGDPNGSCYFGSTRFNVCDCHRPDHCCALCYQCDEPRPPVC